ncbi:MAG: glycogen/starch synthase [Firmicutes bacterium]|jgi:starch synthase|nr:glycogen/starch synthase [Bacillota bacterium]
MIVSLATFEHLPKRVGGLAEAATSIGEALARENEVMVFMPSHSLHKTEKDLKVKKYGKFGIRSKNGRFDVTIYEMLRNGVRVFLLSDEIMDHPDVYMPREMLTGKLVHFARAFPAAINLILGKEGKKPDVVHVNDWHCVLGGAMAKRYFRIPMVYTIHRICREKIGVSALEEAGVEELIDPECVEEVGGNAQFNLETYGCRVCDYLNTVSFTYLNEEWDALFGHYAGKVTYVWNGMDFTFWDPGKLKEAHKPRTERRRALLAENGLDDGDFYFYVGRFDIEQKGVDHLLAAIELIMTGKVRGADRVIPRLRIVVLGSGDPTLERMAREMEARYPRNVKAVIGYLGREVTREYYGASDFCLVPSNFEPFGLVQLEAMCMGSIPIGTRVGGINDTVIDVDQGKDRATGKLVPPRDPKALAEGMVKMAILATEDAALIEKIRANGRPHVMQHFTWEQAAARYLALYQGKATMKLPFADYGGPI